MTTASRRWLLAGGFLSSVALTACVSKSKYEALEAQNATLQQQRAADEAAMAEDKAQITRLQGAIKYTIESDLLFAPGSWELSDAGKATIADMATKLAPTQQNKLVVIGHTDSVPIGPGLEREGISSNQELSQMRAEAVKQFMISQGVDPALVTAVGQGASNPVAANDTAQGRSQNRRVELTLGG